MTTNTTPTGTEAGFDLDELSTYDPDFDNGYMQLRDQFKDGDYYKVEDVKRALARRAAPAPADSVLKGRWEPMGKFARRFVPDAPDTTASALELFKQWKAYPLPEFNGDGNFDQDWLHREWVAFKAGLARASLAPVSAQQGAAEQHNAVKCVSALRAEPAGQHDASAWELTNEDIDLIWQSMPGGPSHWLKGFGYQNFARAVEAELATRCRAEGGVTSDNESSEIAAKAPAAQACPNCGRVPGERRDECEQCPEAPAAQAVADKGQGDE
jgi:hypothetical protein